MAGLAEVWATDDDPPMASARQVQQTAICLKPEEPLRSKATMTLPPFLCLSPTSRLPPSSAPSPSPPSPPAPDLRRFVGSTSDCLQLVLEINKALKFKAMSEDGPTLVIAASTSSPSARFGCASQVHATLAALQFRALPRISKLCNVNVTRFKISGEKFAEFFFGTSASLKKFSSHLPGRVSRCRALPPEFEGDAVQIHLVGHNLGDCALFLIIVVVIGGAIRVGVVGRAGVGVCRGRAG